MANLMNIISPRQCGVVKERNKSKQQSNTASLPHANYGLASTFFNFGQYGTRTTLENMEAEEDHHDDSTVNVDSDVDLFSTMNSGKDPSPHEKPTKWGSPQNTYDKPNQLLNFDGCMPHRKRCSRTCAGDSVTMYGTSNSNTTTSSCKRDDYHHMRKSPSTRSTSDRRKRCNTHSKSGIKDSSRFSFEHGNDIVKICESLSVERFSDSAKSCESSVERKKRVSTSFILSRADSYDSRTISTRASYQSKESNLSLSDLFSKETNTLDSGTLSASASFQSKDTITNITSSDLYSKETLTEENYDSSDSRSESKSTLSSKGSIKNTTNAFHFDRFFRTDSYTDTYDTSDSWSESTVTETSEEDVEEEDGYSSYHSKSSSYTDKWHSSEAGAELDDAILHSKTGNVHTIRAARLAEYSSHRLIENKYDIQFLVESETSSTSGCTTSLDDIPFQRSPIQDDVVLACRSPMEFSAAIEDSRVQETNIDVVLHATSLENHSLPKQSPTTSTSKMASDRADYIIVSLADDTTEISISNMASSFSDVAMNESYAGSVRTKDLYDPKANCSTREQYGISQQSSLSSRSLYEGDEISHVTYAQNPYSRDDEIASSHAVAVHNTLSYAGSSDVSCHHKEALDQIMLPSDFERLDTFTAASPSYDAALSARLSHIQLRMTSSDQPSYDIVKHNTSRLKDAVVEVNNSAASLNLKDSFSNIDQCAADPLLNIPRNYNDAERTIDDPVPSLPLPALTTVSDHKSIIDSHNDYGASVFNSSSLTSTDKPSNPINSCVDFIVDDVNSSSCIQSSDRMLPPHQLEPNICPNEDDLSFFTAMNEPHLSIETDSIYITAANSAQTPGYIFSDFLHGCVQNSLVCDGGNKMSSSSITVSDLVSDGKTKMGDDVHGSSRDIELNGFESSAAEALCFESKTISAGIDQNDSGGEITRDTVEAATRDDSGHNEACYNETKIHAMIEQMDSNDYNAVNMILSDSDINQTFCFSKSDKQCIEETSDVTIQNGVSNEMRKRDYKTGENMAVPPDKHSDQVTAAMSEILLHCRRIELLDEGTSQEAVHKLINSAVMNIVQVCRKFDASADSLYISDNRSSHKVKSGTEINKESAKYDSQKEKEQQCNDFGGQAARSTSSTERGMLSEKATCTQFKHPSKEIAKPVHLLTEPFKDNYPISPSKTPRRSNQRRRAARLMESLNNPPKSTHVYEKTESIEKDAGPSDTSQLKEASQPITVLSVSVEDSLQVRETQALGSPYKLIRQLALPRKAFENQNAIYSEIVRDAPFNHCRSGRRRRASAAAVIGGKLTCQPNDKDAVQNEKNHSSTNKEIAGSSIFDGAESEVNLGNVLAVNEKEESVTDNTAEKEGTGGKTERKLSRKQSERKRRSLQRITTTELTNDTETIGKSSLFKGAEAIESQRVPSTDRLKSAFKILDEHLSEVNTNASNVEQKGLQVSSCSLEERDENTSAKTQPLEMRISTYDVTGIAPSVNDPFAHASPSKQRRRLELAAKMLDLRKNKNRSIKNEGGELDFSFLNESSNTVKVSPKTAHQLYGDTTKMHAVNFREEVVVLASSGSFNSCKASSLSIDTAVQDCSFDETVCTTKHSNVCSTYVRCTAPLPPETQVVGKVDATNALQHPLLSPPRGLYSTPRSLRKLSSPAAARDRMKIARMLWHTDDSKPLE